MSRRPLTGNNNTIDIAGSVGQFTAGVLAGVRGIKFGKNRDGSDDVRWIGDFETQADTFSAWLPTQLRNLLVDVENGELRVPRFSILYLTFKGAFPTKGGGNDTKLFDVEIDDDKASEGLEVQIGVMAEELVRIKAENDAKPKDSPRDREAAEPVAAGARTNGRTRR